MKDEVVARLTVNFIHEMTEKQWEELAKWLEEQKTQLIEKRDELANRYVARFWI